MKCALTCGVSVKGRNLYVCFFQFSLQPDVDVVHQVREQRQGESYGCAVLL